MNVLVTGDRGYIGSVLVEMLRDRGDNVRGLDSGYFSENLLMDYWNDYPKITKDVRDVTIENLAGLDAIIHLAGLSNDPLGEFNPEHTIDINAAGTLRLATLAKDAGVSRFVFASSQSIYGISDVSKEMDEDNSEKNPITAYAIAKWQAEQELMALADNDFTCVFFRPSTVFGASPRLRCDIVFNNMVACAYTTGRIEILSDGSPWRPIVHVRDVANAFIAGIDAPQDLVNCRAYNVGIPNGNFTVRDIAEAAQRAVPGCDLVFTGEHGNDARTYRVNFDRILTELNDYYKPEWTLDRGGKELVEYFDRVGFTEEHFRGRSCIRLKQLQHLSSKGCVQKDMRLSL